jgi:amino acid adenylation domain-containing protein
VTRDTTGLPLWAGFAASAERSPDAVAVECGGASVTYAALRDGAASLAATLIRVRPDASPLTACLVDRDATGFRALLGASMSGTGHVPLNPRVPAPRLAVMLDRSGCTTLVADAAEEARLREILPAAKAVATVVLLGGAAALPSLRETFPEVGFVPESEFAPPDAWFAPLHDPDAPAYLLFTSGSTGTPKGVAVAHRSIRRFLDVATERYALAPGDRFSQMFELVFDLSLFDVYGAFECGGTICCPTAEQMRIPDRYVRDARLTVWFSVPSAAVVLRKLRLLAPGAFPGLRVSLFCGEALPADAAEAWAAAAPGSLVENLYGPTEATLACTAYRWTGESRAASDDGIVPIGAPFPGMSARVVDEALRDVGPGEPGELLVAGPQIALGYWRDAEQTAQRFLRLGGDVFYRTGDRVRAGADGALRYLGRLDHQVKVRGHRVELGDVEAAVRRASGVEVVVAAGWPLEGGSAQGVVAFLQTDAVDPPALRTAVAALVPAYMTPTRFVAVPSMPLNPNGKVDRSALMTFLETPRHAPPA